MSGPQKRALERGPALYPMAMVGRGVPSPEGRWKDGHVWRIGADADVAWLQGSVTPGLTIDAAIPLVFPAYATIDVPDKPARTHDFGVVLQLLRAQSGDQRWWLGYLETGADDVVFPAAPRVRLYQGWPYVLVQGGPDEAARWRHDLRSWRAPGPDLIFPVDRSWLLSWLWDDDWRCLGGPTALVDRFVSDPRLRARRVSPDEDATPPGHTAR